VENKGVFRFGPFLLDVNERTLQREGTPIPLTPKVLDLLHFFVENPGKLVKKSTVLETVWTGVHVDESVLTRAVSDLRRALGEESRDTSIIQTVPKFGYRFTAHVESETPAPSTPADVEEPTIEKVKARKGPAFRSIIVAAVALLVVLTAIARRNPSRAPIQDLAVLPFQVLTPSTQANQLSLGLADALIMRLSALRGVVVRPVSAVRKFMNTNIDPRQAGAELKADTVLEGTLQMADGVVRASVRLVRVSDGESLWSTGTDSITGSMFAVQDMLAEQVAANLRIHLSASERDALAQRTDRNPAVHSLYVRGRYEWGRRNREGFERSADLFREAIDLDPSYARAWAGLADSQLMLALYDYVPPLEMLPEAKSTAERALSLDPHLGEAEATLALVSQNLDWNWPEVERHYRLATAMTPGYATAHHWYAEFLSVLGRFHESEREFAAARRIDPISPAIQVDEAQLYFFERKYATNRELLGKALAADRSFTVAHERLAQTWMLEGREDEAWREAQLVPDCREGQNDCREIWTAWLANRDRRAAEEALAWLETESIHRRVAPSALVIANARQGHLDRAFHWLDYMLAHHEVWLITAKVNPVFDPLRKDPRFSAVLDKLAFD
jgi:DNA-binding winged helix-turn-helix (wHTH) protein/TolB-like protein/Tfp pilus assembly protein PilF